MMTPEALARMLSSERCVLFLGSGVSIPAPSSLPSAAWIVEVFLRRFSAGILSPTTVAALLERWPLPEFVYGTVERFFGPEIYDIWRALDRWRSFGAEFSANPGHVLAAHLAAVHGLPVLTPNFDTYLEDAADQLGLPTSVTVAKPGEPFLPAPLRTGTVAIWKLHGTVQDPATVFSSVRTLTAPILGLDAAVNLATRGDARLVLAGYSGRDLDLFPVLNARPHTKRPVWVDLRFGTQHRSRFMAPAAIEVTGSFDQLAIEVGRLVGGRVGVVMQHLVDKARALPETAAAELRAQIHDSVTAMADRFSAHDRRVLVLAEMLVNSGLPAAAEALLESAPPVEELVVEHARLRSKALWELGRYETAQRVAKDARAAARSASEGDILSFAIAAAELRIRVPPRGLGGTRRPSARSLLGVVVAATLLLVRGSRRVRHPEFTPEPIRTPFVEGYLEHAIRILLGVQFAMTRPDGTPVALLRRPLAALWRRVHRACQRAGYAEGMGNAARYLSRLGAVEPGGERGAHEFLGHTLGMAIALRDVAQRRHDAGDDAAAREAFESGLQLAVSHGDPVLLLTFEPLGRRLGIDTAAADGLLATIEAPWAEEHRAWRRAQGRAER